MMQVEEHYNTQFNQMADMQVDRPQDLSSRKRGIQTKQRKNGSDTRKPFNKAQ
jgi:hypothetical protein